VGEGNHRLVQANILGKKKAEGGGRQVGGLGKVRRILEGSNLLPSEKCHNTSQNDDGRSESQEVRNAEKEGVEKGGTPTREPSQGPPLKGMR